MFETASHGTPDGKRINSDTTIRMLVDLPDQTPSRAITFTTDKSSNDEGFKRIAEEYEEKSKGSTEGDIPCVVLEDKPKIKFYFQDTDYNNIAPEKILSVRADSTNVISGNQKTESALLRYDFRKCAIIIDPGQIKYDRDKATGEIWYDVSFIVQYRYNGHDYTSVTTLTVFNKRAVAADKDPDGQRG
jgi:hypothetical protein